ncbi:Nuclear fragile X mental retardation-interacting protein 1 [Schistosoma japonicum]|nr:Nuclear fragile X mental retardation-interacting protein 1 [Schistosoma japonicum]
MELPPFDLLYSASDKLSELETALKELDQSKIFKDVGRRRRRRRYGGLYGIGFEVDDCDYYNPVEICCDIAFYTNEEYKRHLDRHIKCPVEGCPFTSHPKAMRVHQEVIHDSGLFNAIYRETCDKSVKAWRESRKRNYPTLERVQAKKKLIEERIDRGEIFETRQFGSMNKPNSNVLRPPHAASASSSSQKIPTSSNKMSKREINNSVTACQEPSTRLVSVDYDSESTDNDNSFIKDKSSGDLIDTTTTTESVQKTNNNSKSRRRKRRRQRKNTADHKSIANNNLNSENHTDSKNDPFASHPLVKLQAKRRQCLSNIHRIHSRPTLLQMLLAEDIRKERNQLMQCIRYIVNENFFQE